MEDMPEVETVVVPIGGGGLISGISTALKESKPNVRVIGVQAAAVCPYYVSRQNGHPSASSCLPTVADGLICTWPGEKPYPIIEDFAGTHVFRSQVLSSLNYLDKLDSVVLFSF